VKYLISPVIVAILILANPPARAASQEIISQGICFGGSDALSLLSTVRTDRSSIRDVAEHNRAFTLSKADDVLSIVDENGRSLAKIHIVTAATEKSKRISCGSVPTTQRAASGASIPASFLLALEAVSGYRIAHPWKNGADLQTSDSEVRIRAFKQYFLVLLADQSRSRNAQGQVVSLGCDGFEYYRVSASFDQVLPFNGCVEGGGVRGLPRLTQLPPR